MSGPLPGVRPATPAGIDPDRLASWLAGHLPWPGPLGAVTLLAGGRSNLTYRVEWGDRPLVLRRPPLGHVLATAHDMAREHRVLTALGPTPVPVPRTGGLCEDPGVLGAPFYVMELADGIALRGDADLAPFGPRAAGRIAYALVDTLATLHAVDAEACGLGGFGRPEGFMARQVRRWRRQWDDSRTREVPGADRLNDRLAAGCPPSVPGRLVHGDFKLDNVLLDSADPGRVTAVLDWEMATLGDPLADLGMFCMYWDGFGGLDRSPVASPGALPGWPRTADLVRRYARHHGDGLEHLDWYVAFAFYKIAAILEGIHCRAAAGLTVGDESADVADAVPVLVERGHAVLDGLR
ncbi:phosphotransferase family protein [Streptomyces sp. SL13]|uniref:Phosphotransferase family protein n=1 Tax=Streptantibioticus silvisoli TaxID=2705255 RepID=A0AA90GUW8_9ACTN|nr:phosphotransferase family protein [Streptantibioticus silvisoli]MDI5963311.1 phosphotransferase family protein [Streptantibioticus silvisoli]MDI5968508.1 phosphotransferase family protein [Streptantibioticus silvisoli]